MADGRDDFEWHIELEADLGANRPGASASRRAGQEAAKVSWFQRLVARLGGRHTDERAWRRGAEGERAVGSELEALGSPWVVVHDIPIGDRGANIDHIVVGPTGVFCVNAKYLSGNVWVAERALLHNGHKTPYLPKAAREADRVSRLLSAAAGHPVEATPVIALVGAQLTVKRPPKDVVVVRKHHLRRALTRRPPVLRPAAIGELERHVRRPSTWSEKSVGKAKARRGAADDDVPVTVRRWRRHGHDRLYANDSSGSSHGWMELNTGRLHDIDPQHGPVVEAMLKRRAARIYRFE